MFDLLEEADGLADTSELAADGVRMTAGGDFANSEDSRGDVEGVAADVSTAGVAAAVAFTLGTGRGSGRGGR